MSEGQKKRGEERRKRRGEKYEEVRSEINVIIREEKKSCRKITIEKREKEGR